MMTRRLGSMALAGSLVAVAACTGGGSTPAQTPTPAASPSSWPTAESRPITIERGLPFATFDDRTLTLDLWLPADPNGAPIVFDPYYPNDIARAGAFVVSVDTGVGDPPDNDDAGVRFLGDHGAFVRAQAEEIACAIRFGRERAAALGSDDPVVVLSAFSSPGGPATHVALLGDTLDERWGEFAATVGGPPRQVECVVPDGSTHVDALVGTNGTYDLYVPAIEGLYGRTYQEAFDPELQAFLASALGADPELVVRLFHGTRDKAIPTTVSEDFAAALADAGYDVQYTPFDGGHDAPPAELGLPVYLELLGLAGG
jgi:hypothetical protein